MHTLIALSGGCTGERVHSPANGNNSNVADTAGVGNNSAGSRDGVEPKDTGIDGTGEGNANSAVKGNSNVEPAGVNKNVGQGTATNINKR